jgi:hypothetical protein
MRPASRFTRNRRLRLSATIFTIALLSLVPGNFALGQEDNKPPKGFTALFNGTDFKDWTGGATRDPREIAALPPSERAKYDADMKRGIEKHWKVENGELVSDGHEPYLATKRDYGDFELWVDWKINAKGDSGIYLRGVPQVQIWDPTDQGAKKNGADKGSGALWNNKKNERFPPEVADKPLGEWNRTYIRMVGPYVTVKLNDKLVVDDVIMENYKPEIPIYATGPIYLQTHGSETRFRNVFVREISAEESNQLLAEIAGDEKQFESVFNGKDLSGWIGPVDDYEVKDGAIQCKPERGGNLFTKDEFDNFVVRFEFRLPPGGNNGLALRAPVTQDQLAYAATEIQILDDAHPQYADLHDYQVHGSLYGMAPAARGYLRPVGEWNCEEVSLDGDQLKVCVNGFEVLNTNIAEVSKQPIDGKAHPGASRKSGHLALCGHNDPVAIRNIRVKRLP